MVGGDQFKECIFRRVAEIAYQANWFHSRSPNPHYKGVMEALSRTTVLGGPSARDIVEARYLVRRMNYNYNSIRGIVPFLVHLRKSPKLEHIYSHHLFCNDALRGVVKLLSLPPSRR